MIHLKKIKEIIRKEGKRPSKKAIDCIDKMIQEKIKEIVLHAKRNADFAGRRTILKEDLV